VLATPRKPQ
jgi:hypothetical protein